MALFGVHDVHELGAYRMAVGLLQGVDNGVQGRRVVADFQIAHLKRGVEVGQGQFVKAQFQIRGVLALSQTERVQAGLLMTSMTVRRNQRQDFDLLALVLGGLAVVGEGGFGAHPHLADAGETLAHGAVRDIVDKRGFAVDSRQLAEIIAPGLGHRVGIDQIAFIEIFDVGGVAAGDVRAAQKPLHRTFVHASP